MSEIGWVSIHRKIRDCIIWESNEPFDSRSAWIDLILMANHEDKEILFDGQPIIVKRGQRITSLRSLAERWHWSVNRVRRYIALLEEFEMVHRECDNRRTLLTIVNYGEYQIDGTQTNTQTDTLMNTQTEHRRIHRQHTNNNENNENNENKNIYGEYKHVKLSADDLEKLHKEYGEQMTNDCIKFLDEYIEMKGYKAKNHYLCIKRWVVKAVKEKQPETKKGFSSGNGSESLDAFIKMMEG